MTCSCYFSDLLSSHSLCSRHAGPLTVHPAGRGSHLQAFSLLSFHQEKLFAQIAIQVIPSLPSGFITGMSALTTLPHSGTSNPTPPGSSCLLPFFFLHNNIVISNMLCIILKSLRMALISASTLRHNIVLWSLYWPEVSEDTFKGFSEAFSAPWEQSGELCPLLQF